MLKELGLNLAVPRVRARVNQSIEYVVKEQ
jgi:hypothetical protein